MDVCETSYRHLETSFQMSSCICIRGCVRQLVEEMRFLCGIYTKKAWNYASVRSVQRQHYQIARTHLTCFLHYRSCGLSVNSHSCDRETRAGVSKAQLRNATSWRGAPAVLAQSSDRAIYSLARHLGGETQSYKHPLIGFRWQLIRKREPAQFLFRICNAS